MEKSEQQGQHVRLGFEPGTSRLPIFSGELLYHLWGLKHLEARQNLHIKFTQISCDVLHCNTL